MKEKNLKWSEVEDKNNSVYVPILQAFIDEIKKSYMKDKNISRKIVEYLIGVKDYFCDNSPKISLPTELVAIKFKNNSKNTVEMYLSNGWQISFRIHNASTKVEPSLKFDIRAATNSLERGEDFQDL